MDFIGAAIDITSLRRAEAAIQAREAQFRSFAEHSANETSFPIRDAQGEVVRIGGIAEVLTRHDGKQVYLVGSWRAEERRLRRLLRAAGLRVRTFTSADAFLEIAPFLGPGCVLVDLRRAKRATAMITRELRARSIPLKAVLIGPDDGGVAVAVDAMKSGAADYLQAPVADEALMASLASIAPEAGVVCDEGAVDGAAARLARLTSREREVLDGLVGGGTNKSIALHLGLSPRTVELHRGQIMAKLGAANLVELLQMALNAGLRPAARRA